MFFKLQMKPPLKKSQSSPPVRELGKPPSDAKVINEN